MSSTHELPVIFSAQNATESHEIYLALRQKNLQVTRCAAMNFRRIQFWRTQRWVPSSRAYLWDILRPLSWWFQFGFSGLGPLWTFVNSEIYFWNSENIFQAQQWIFLGSRGLKFKYPISMACATQKHFLSLGRQGSSHINSCHRTWTH